MAHYDEQREAYERGDLSVEPKFNINIYKLTGEELSKRFYCGGVVLEVKCPNCGEIVTRDFGQEYLSYPVAGTKEDLDMYCEGCDHEWKAGTVKVNVELEVKLNT